MTFYLNEPERLDVRRILAPFPNYGWLYVEFSLATVGHFTLTPTLEWFDIKFTFSETRRIALPDAENRTIVSSFVWTKHRNVTDRQTHRQTDSP